MVRAWWPAGGSAEKEVPGMIPSVCLEWLEWQLLQPIVDLENLEAEQVWGQELKWDLGSFKHCQDENTSSADSKAQLAWGSTLAAITKYCTQRIVGSVNNRSYRLTVLQAGNLISGCQQGWVLMRALLLDGKWLSSCYVSHDRVRDDVSFFSCKTIIL